MSKLPAEVAAVIPIRERQHGKSKNGFWLRGADIEAVDRLIAYYEAGTESTRDRVIAATRKGTHSLQAYVHAMAALAVRRNDAALLFRGIIALAIDNVGYEESSTAYSLAMLGNSARILQVNEDELFHQFLPLARPELLACIHAYLSRSPRSRRLALGKYREEGKGETFNYVYRGR